MVEIDDVLRGESVKIDLIIVLGIVVVCRIGPGFC